MILFLALSASVFLGFGLAFVAILRTQYHYNPLLAYHASHAAGNAAAEAESDSDYGPATLRSTLAIPFWAIVGEGVVCCRLLPRATFALVTLRY